MNKSLVLRNKIYRFCFLLLSFFLFLYLFFFLIKGDKGIYGYYKTIQKHSLIKKDLNILKEKNNNLKDKISRLSPDTLDLEYLDEQLRLNAGKVSDKELIIIVND